MSCEDRRIRKGIKNIFLLKPGFIFEVLNILLIVDILKICLVLTFDDFSIVFERMFEGSLLFNFTTVFQPIESNLEAKTFTKQVKHH